MVAVLALELTIAIENHTDIVQFIFDLFLL